MPTVRKPIDLMGGYWADQYPSPVPGVWAEAVVHQARSAEYVPWQVVPSAATHTPPVDCPVPDEIFPAAGGPAWVRGMDFTVTGKVVTFLVNLQVAVAHKVDPDTGKAVIWCRATTAAVSPKPQSPGYPSLIQAVEDYTDSPAFSAAGTVSDIALTARGYVIVTETEVVTLPPTDAPSVAVGDVVAIGDPAGLAWRLVRLGPAAPPAAEPSVAVPADVLPPAVGATIIWPNQMLATAVDTTQPLTRIRFPLAGDPLAVGRFWQAVEAAEASYFGTTLAQALDTRATPFGEPTAGDLPIAVNPAALLCTFGIGGHAYMLVTDPDRFGETRDTLALTDYPGGPHAAIFEWADGIPAGSNFLAVFAEIHGSATVLGVGRSFALATGTAAGTGTALGDASASFLMGSVPKIGTAAGTSTVLGVGRKLWATTGTAAGTGTALGVPSMAGTGSATGTSTMVAGGLSLARSVGTITTVSNAPGIAIVPQGVAAGTSQASGVGQSLVLATGSAAGTSTMNGTTG